MSSLVGSLESKTAEDEVFARFKVIPVFKLDITLFAQNDTRQKLINLFFVQSLIKTSSTIQ